MIDPPSTVHNKQLWQKHRRKVRALAQRIIDGKVGVIEGSLQMLALQIWLHAKKDDDFRIFHTIYSLTTHLPVGKVREHWSPDALKEKDKEIKSIADLYRKPVIEAATQIQQKYL